MGNLPKLTQFVAGSLTKSINIHSPDLGPNLEFSPATINVSQGITEGTGPRNGMAPIPGHSDTETLAAGKYPGIMASEASWINVRFARQKIFAIHPLGLGGVGASGINVRSQYYAVVIGYTDSSNSGKLFCDVVFLGTYTTPGSINIAQQTTLISDGLSPNAAAGKLTGSASAFSPDTVGIFEFVTRNTLGAINIGVSDIELLNQIPTASNYVSSTPFSVSNGMIATPWLLGVTAGTANDATHAPSINLTAAYQTASATNPGYNAYLFTGITSEIVYGNFKVNVRKANIFAIKADGNQNIDYQMTLNASTSVFVPTYDYSEPVTVNINLSATTATKISAATTYSSTALAVYNDPDMSVNASHTGVLVAAGKPLCYIFQDWIRSTVGTLQQEVDLVNLLLAPASFNDGLTSYKENGQFAPSCFSRWPDFVRGTGMVTNTLGTGLGVANTGILRANTVYEFTYALYNKRLNIESNVGVPVKVQTGSVDFTSLIIFDAATTSPNVTAMAALQVANLLLFPPSSTSSGPNSMGPLALNHLEYRFYYRQEGFQEFLPALFIDAVKYWFYPYNTKLSACTGGIGGLIGGRPGGFQDYSRIPADIYSCVVMYKNRAFWFSDKQVVFSLQNNIFAYPSNNSASCPIGSFKGAIVQAYYGQAQQDARLVIFTTAGTYVGKFSGVQQQVPVQVSPTSVANFALDGSDFEVNAWTSISAYSYRSAVVAEGILYMWGPSGIFRDDGVNFITRISMPLEPAIFNYCDPSLTDSICTLYNDTSKEIYWFYPPKVADGYATHAIVYNTVRESWLFAKFSGSIDYAQQIIVKSSIATAGTRGVVFTRQSSSATVQRAAYFDQNNRSGDIFPTGELMVKSFTTPATGQRAFTLAAGYDATKFATIAAGDLIAVSQASAYASTLVTPTDLIAVVVSAAAGVITVTLPSGASFDASATFANNSLYMPIWHWKTAANGINGFPYVLDTYYWLPGGFAYWAYWLHVHMLFKLNQILPAATALSFNIAYRTPVSEQGAISQTITIANNSDANFQVLHPLQVGDQNIEGQGMKFTISGIQGAGSWMIQYLEAYTQYLDGMQLKLFEG